ncbi:MAG TPA: hypothetical protein VGM90_16865 [Kofleriaceae bacterium]
MRRISLFALAVVFTAVAQREARADVIGLGVFVGEPAGLDIKVDFKPRSSLESVIGWTTFRDGRTNYGHLTYLYTLATATSATLSIPLRLGIGGAIYNTNDVQLGARVPLELGLRFRRTPIEIYGEIALFVRLTNDTGFDTQGGIGLRFYF